MAINPSPQPDTLPISSPARLLDIFSTPSRPRTSVDYSVSSVASFASSTPPLSSPSVYSLSSSLSSAMSAILPTPPHLSRSASIPSKHRPSNPPSAFQPSHHHNDPYPSPSHIPTRSERLLAATLARAEAAHLAHHARSHSYSPPSTPPYPSPRSSTGPSPAADDPDWLAEIAEQSCMRPSRSSPVDRMGRTTSAVHVSRSPSPAKMARMTKEREQHRRALLARERQLTGDGATFGPMPVPSVESMGSLVASSSRRPDLHLSTSPSPTGGFSSKHTDWPWEPTSPTAKPKLRPARPTTGRTTNTIVKPHMSRSQTSPSATLRRSSTTGGRPPLRHHTASGSVSQSKSPRPDDALPARPRSSASGPITPPPSPPFDAQSTSLLLKHREGYVSFRDVEGLGSPEDEEDEEGRESEGEKKRGRGRWWVLGWAR